MNDYLPRKPARTYQRSIYGLPDLCPACGSKPDPCSCPHCTEGEHKRLHWGTDTWSGFFWEYHCYDCGETFAVHPAKKEESSDE